MEPLFAAVLREVAVERERAASSTLDSTSASRSFGYLPREATADQVHLTLEHDINPFTNQPYTAQYRKILEGRKTLPVFAHMARFNKHQIIIMIGETGSGKTTQIPQFVAYSDLPHTKNKIVACTQTRRVATTAVAERVADEMDVQLGQQVGYSIRFEDMTEPGTTFLKYMTDGILLREAMHDPDLSRYSTIIVDDAHERTLATDILMGVLKTLARRRPDLKLIIMSATLDALKFQEYFAVSGGALPPLFKVPGRTHPVEVFYIQDPVSDYVKDAIRLVLKIHCTEKPGDILVFLTGEEEIEGACHSIKLEVDDLIKSYPETVGPLECIPLYSWLPPQQQQRIFDPPPKAGSPSGPQGRKVVVSTNIAESSLTIDGIVYVVDPGFSKQKVYNPSTRVESLLVSPISKESAQQRTGRAGRTRPGKCYRLYTKKDFMSEFKEQTEPEILRSNLVSTVLMLVKAGIKDLVKFDYLDEPAPESLMRALEILNYLAAVDDDGNLTALGSIMAEFPLDPQVGDLPNVWLRPSKKREEADAAKALLTVPGGDHLILLNVYNEYIQNQHDKDWTWIHYLSAPALLQAVNVREQLERTMGRFEVDLVNVQDRGEMSLAIKQALCCGFFMQAAHKVGGKRNYMTLNNQPVVLHPSCRLDTQPEWVIFNEFLVTNSPYIRTVTGVRPEWLLQYARLYFDLKDWPDSQTKRALMRVANKTTGRLGVRF
ncbi:P-loop containing nucleoside triphosphate hydrolase protein [Suillus subluteus]|nr:P-loop containing nucleoside triphosphate hydrolase protein [Suillus subluteus]